MFRVDSSLRRDIQRISEEEQRTITQICEMLLYEGVEAYKKEGPKFIQRLVAKQKYEDKMRSDRNWPSLHYPAACNCFDSQVFEALS